MVIKLMTKKSGMCGNCCSRKKKKVVDPTDD